MLRLERLTLRQKIFRKNVFLASCLFLGAFCFVAHAADSPTEDNVQGELPRIDFVSLRQDFGDMYRGERRKARFDFVNKGDGVLHIRSIHAACGCVKTNVEPKDNFLPGEKGSIAFEFDSSYFAGDVVRTVTVDTNAPSPSTVTLTFTAKVKQEIFAKPTLLSLGEISKGTSKELFTEVSFASRGAGPDTLPMDLDKNSSLDSATKKRLAEKGKGSIEVVKVTTSSPLISVEMVPKEGGAKLVAKVAGNLPIGSFRERISVWNTSTHLKELVIPVIGEVTGHVKPSAKYIEFGVVKGAKTVRRTLTLESDSKDFKVSDVKMEMRPTELLRGINQKDLLKTVFEKQKADGNATTYAVHFDMRFPDSLDEESRPVNASGVFVVKTNDEDYKEIRVPFFGILRRE